MVSYISFLSELRMEGERPGGSGSGSGSGTSQGVPPGKRAPEEQDDDNQERNVFGGERSDAIVLFLLLVLAIFTEMCHRRFFVQC